MNRHKNLQEIEMLQVFFRKGCKALLTPGQSKVELTSCDVSKLLVGSKSNFRPDKVELSGPVLHSRFQPLWLAILLDLNARQTSDSDEHDYKFAAVELIEKSERICQALGLRTIRYSLSDVSYFLSLLIEFKFDIVVNTTIRSIAIFSEISYEHQVKATSIASVSINPTAAATLYELTNRTAVFLTTLFFSKRTTLYVLLQKLLLKKEVLVLSDIAPATIKDLKTLCHHGVITYTSNKQGIDIHKVSVYLEGVDEL